ncbi:SDR family oxidoreductase [Candidatus Bipolaricaulota bacterium]
MDLGVRGKTAMVGGASRGLGLAICERMAAEGANLVMVSRGAGALTLASEQLTTEHGVETMAIPGDQSRKDDVERILSSALGHFGTIDILVHNTGGPPPGLFRDHDDAAWTAAFEGLLLSVVRMCRGVLPGMQERGWGRIVIDTSFTVKEPAPRLVLSNVFRTGVVALAKTLSREVAADGITVNCVCPGAFDTDRLRSIFEEQALAADRTPQDIQKEWESRIPIGRTLQPEELASLVAFLVSDHAGGITGGSFPIEGGMLHGLF